MISKLNQPLIEWSPKGLYCGPGDFYIDPHRAVKTAVVTHAHSDHARRGCEQYLCVESSVGLMRARLGKNIRVRGIPYREKFKLGSFEVSFHSAGHILGSAQVRVEYQGEVWVASGDYKRDRDPSCEPFESVACDTFITEATFGTPKYVWDSERDHGHDIHEWWKQNAALGLNSVVFGYSLGKAQRILAELADRAHRPVLIHDTIVELTEIYRQEGRHLAPTQAMSDLPPGVLNGELILAPPSILETDEWRARLGKYRTAFASGWMVGGNGWGRGQYDHGFVMSDHADWAGLNRTIDETGAKRVFVQHRSGALLRHLRLKGIEAHPADALAADQYARLGGQNLSLF